MRLHMWSTGHGVGLQVLAVRAKLLPMPTGLELLDLVVYGQTVFHRDHDAWVLIDEDGLVAAVLCPRKSHLSISSRPNASCPNL